MLPCLPEFIACTSGIRSILSWDVGVLVAINNVNGYAAHVASNMLQAACQGRGMTDGVRGAQLSLDDGEEAIMAIGLLW